MLAIAIAIISRWFFTLLVSLILSGSLAADSVTAKANDYEEIETLQFSSEGDKLLLITPSSHGITSGLLSLSNKLSKLGVEVWVADPFSTWFLPEGLSSLGKIPTTAYAGLISKAHQHASLTGKKLYLFTFDRGTQGLLEATRKWQAGNQEQILDGVILASPNLYRKTPSAGKSGEFLPIAKATNHPIFLFSTEKSTLALRLQDTISALKSGGSDVFAKVLHGVRDRFFFRTDASQQEKLMTEGFPKMIIQAMRMTSLYAKLRLVAPIPHVQIAARSKVSTGKLLPYKGTLSVKDFKLEDLSGKQHSLSNYKGQVVLLNFWASWCPPCVHEMPSMSQLNATLSNKPFSILAVNLGEPRADIEQFIETHPVNFPVLLDSKQILPKAWKVFAFPTSFIVDKQGKIRFSVAGGIDWNEQFVRNAIDMLVEEKNSL